MISAFRHTPWQFVTSEGAEIDALIFATGKGSFYVKDTTDPDGIVHELLYVGLGAAKGKGPIPFGIGGSFSSPDMWSDGLAPIMRHARVANLTPDDFAGVGTIISGAFGAPAVFGRSLRLVVFGFPVPRAVGAIAGAVRMAPGAGASFLGCWFEVDP